MRLLVFKFSDPAETLLSWKSDVDTTIVAWQTGPTSTLSFDPNTTFAGLNTPSGTTVSAEFEMIAYYYFGCAVSIPFPAGKTLFVKNAPTNVGSTFVVIDP